jgi:hypothetical protein
MVYSKSMHLLKSLRKLGRVYKSKHGGYGNEYTLTFNTKRKTVYLKISVFKRK